MKTDLGVVAERKSLMSVLLVYIYMTYDRDLVNDVTHNFCTNCCAPQPNID